MSDDEPDMRHPKIQSLIGRLARARIELDLAACLLDPAYEPTATDVEHWTGLHDGIVALQRRVSVAQ